jgi:protocatechuate 3,4-dioxygenase beta subunit
MPVGGSVVRALVLFAAFQSPQSPPPAAPAPTGLILGTVVDAATGRPVSGAIVTLQGAGNAPRAMTNASGQFVFRRLPKGRFGLTAAKQGYVEGAYGRRRPGGSASTVALDDGQRVGDVVISMFKHAIISGTVSDEAGEPMIGVTVRLFAQRYTAGHQRFLPAGNANTDDRGVYRFAGIAPGSYIVAFVSREVSIPADVAASTPNFGTPDPRAQSVLRERMSLGFFGGGVGNGSGVRVGPTLRGLDQSGPVPPILEDDAAPAFVYPTIFYPNAPSAARAAIVTIASGQQRDAVDISLHPVRATRVVGSVVGPDGPAANISVHFSSSEGGTEIETAAAMTDASGTFSLLTVVPGDYVVRASRIPLPPMPPQQQNTVMTTVQVGGMMSGMSSSVGTPTSPPIPDDPALYANTPVTVPETGNGNVVVVLQHGGRVSGHVEFDGTAAIPDGTALARIPVMLERADNATIISPNGPGGLSAPPGRIDETGAFKTYGQAPGRYLLRVGGAPGGWTLKSAIADGRDISDTPFDIGTSDVGNVVITFTDRPAKLTGVAHTKDGAPDPDALVIVFPADPSKWSDFGLNPRRLRSVRPGQDGTYTFNGLPVGEYFVMAIPADSNDAWQNADALADLSRAATAVRVAEGDTRTQDVVRSGGL